jgi:hypothetical protein
VKFTVSTILYIVAIVLFLMGALGINLGTIAVAWLGLAALAGGMLMAEWKM